MPAPLAPALWAEIRRHWEYDPDTPSYAQAAGRAASVHGFTASGRSAVQRKASAEGWKRKGSMAGVAVAAHRRADALVDAAGIKKAAVEGAANMQISREESENARAGLIARHRQEWAVAGELVNEALACRASDPSSSFGLSKSAKITAETIAIKQAGERKAWGMDVMLEVSEIDVTKLTDAQLEAIVKGKV